MAWHPTNLRAFIAKDPHVWPNQSSQKVQPPLIDAYNSLKDILMTIMSVIATCLRWHHTGSHSCEILQWSRESNRKIASNCYEKVEKAKKSRSRESEESLPTNHQIEYCLESTLVSLFNVDLEKKCTKVP